MRFFGSLFVGASLASGALAQVTATNTPDAEEYSQIKSDIASYYSALTTESLYLEAKSYVDAHSTSVPAIGMILHTDSWSQDISSFNALVTTTFESSFPTVVASLYHSALSAQASIINADLAATTSSAPLVTGTGGIMPSGNGTTTFVSPTPSSGTATSSGASPSSTTGAGNAQVVLNGMMMFAGLGVALLV